jgi:TetR/AcrR family transcriptional regulator, lmrAB and yxaGH operons repressor
MAVTRVPDKVLLEKVAEIFRRHGYEGASIRLLSEATGLERASLYHRFPGGKEEMATAIIAQDCQWLTEHVFLPLQGPGTPAERVTLIAANLREFYKGGTLGCILDSLTVGAGTGKIRAMIQSAYQAWLGSFTGISVESGLSQEKARSRAQQAIIEIEGSLVLARVTGDSAAFLSVIDKLPGLLCGVSNA